MRHPIIEKQRRNEYKGQLKGGCLTAWWVGYWKVNAPTTCRIWKIQCIQQSARDEHCSHACFLFLWQSGMCIFLVDKASGKEGMLMRRAIAQLSESAWLSFHIFKKIYKCIGITCFHFENVLVDRTARANPKYRPLKDMILLCKGMAGSW